MNYEEESYELNVTINDKVTTTTMFTYSENDNFSGFWFYNNNSSYAVNDKGEIISSSNLENFNLENGTFVRRIDLNEGEVGETQNDKNDKRIVYIGEKTELNDGIEILYNKDTLEIIKCSDESKNYVGKYYVKFNKPISETETETEIETIQLIVEIDEENNTCSIIYSSQPGYSVAIDNTVTEITGVNFDITDDNNENKVVYAYRSRDIENTEFKSKTVLLGIHLTSDVTEIGVDAFYKCANLEKITIPNNVTEIGSYAFYNCSGLIQVTISNSVTSISEYAFCGCESLTQIEIPDKVETIGENAFYNCIELTQIEIPNSVTTISEQAFYECRKLEKITIRGTLTYVDTTTFNTDPYLTSPQTLTIYCNEATKKAITEAINGAYKVDIQVVENSN